MINLKAKEVNPLDVISSLRSKYSLELNLKFQSLKETGSNENIQIDKENFINMLSELNFSIEEQNYSLLIESLTNIFMLLNNQKHLSQEIIATLQNSCFFQNVKTCICVLRQPEINILFFVLEYLAYLSNDLIEQMLENDILNEIMAIFVNTDNEVSKRILFYLFGNSCSIDHISSNYQQDIFNLLCKTLPIFEEWACPSDSTKTSCLYCLFVITKYFKIPNELTRPFFTYFKTILREFIQNTEAIIQSQISQANENKFESGENDEDQYEDEYYDDQSDTDEYDEDQSSNNENVLEYYELMVNYIIDILDKYSRDKEECKNIVDTMIPSTLLGNIIYFPNSIKKKFLLIIKNTLQSILKIQDQEVVKQLQNSLFKHSETDSEVFILVDLLNSSDNKIIEIVYDVLYEIEFINEELIKILLPRNLIPQSLHLMNLVDFNAKISILNFLSLLLTNDLENQFSDVFINELFIEQLTEITEQSSDLCIFEDSKEVPVSEKLQPCCIGAISKLFELTFDQPDLNLLLEPFVVSPFD